MRIQHNVSALNAHRQLMTNNSAVSKNLEKLSSGYAINRAGDNAAGLAISEKMRGQIRGLDQAESNAQDGISLIQTAEGGLNETHSILQRMRELAVQSSNGTYQNEVDRENLQQETDALKSEIDRIASSTHFNKIQLLDGSLASGSTSTKGVNAEAVLSKLASSKGASNYVDAAASQNGVTVPKTLPTTATGDKFDYTVRVNDKGVESQYTVSFEVQKIDSVDYFVAKDGTKYAAKASDAKSMASNVKQELEKVEGLKDEFSVTADADGGVYFKAREKGANVANVVSASAENYVAASNTTTKDAMASTLTVGTDSFQTLDTTKMVAYDGTNAADSVFEVNGSKFAFVANGTTASTLDSDVNYISVAAVGAPTSTDAAAMTKLINQKTGLSSQATDATGKVDGTVTNNSFISLKASAASTSKGAAGLTFQIGANGSKDQRVSLSVGDMSANGIGVKTVSIATQTAANKAINTIDDAINAVSKQRAGLGALQNRLEHTVSNLGTTSENLTTAESRIRDVDMAKEMVQMSKNNILTQAAQSMLAQANTQPQGVLQLLK